jgi:GNAT superfamily N-acetyltransferase
MDSCYVDYEHRGIADVTNLGEMVPKTRTITRINIPEESRGRGLGTKLLRRILADADAEGVILSLEIMPSGPLDYNALEAWYRRWGFKPWKKHPMVFIRRPRPCNIAKYNVITNGVVTYGFRCGPHRVWSRRYSTEELRAQRIAEHKEEPTK